MGIFKNKTFNLVYYHSGFQAIAAHGGEAFAMAYLLKAGLPAPLVLLSVALMFTSRLLFRMLVLPVAKRIGVRNGVIVGLAIEGAGYPLLAFIDTAGPLLVVYLLFSAIGSSFYWTCQHSYVALVGDKEHAGAQTSGMAFVDTTVGIGAPIMSGLLLHYFPPLVAFSVVGLAMWGSGVPLLLGPNPTVPDEEELPGRIKNLARIIMFADGLRAASHHFIWMLALFITLSTNFAAFGGTLALAGIAGAVMGLFTGRFVDLGNARRALQVGFALVAISVAVKAFGYNAIWSAVLANAFSALIWPIFATANNSRVYNLSRMTKCPLRYNIVAEGGWDLGTAVGCSFAALMIYLGFGFFWPIMFGVVAVMLGYWALAKSFELET